VDRQLGENRAAVTRFGQQQLDAQREQFGDIPIENPLTGNRLEDDLDSAADDFQDAGETVLSNLGRTQPAPVTVGVAGTRTPDETTSGIRGAGAESAINALSPPAVIRDAKEAAEFGIVRGDEIAQETTEPLADLLAGNEVATETELQQDVQQRANLVGEAAAENPQETAASVAGGLVGGAAGGFAASRAVRGGLRGVRSIDVSADDIASAQIRGQSASSSNPLTGGGNTALDDLFDSRTRFRQRQEPGRDLPDEQEQIERTEQIELTLLVKTRLMSSHGVRVCLMMSLMSKQQHASDYRHDVPSRLTLSFVENWSVRFARKSNAVEICKLSLSLSLRRTLRRRHNDNELNRRLLPSVALDWGRRLLKPNQRYHALTSHSLSQSPSVSRHRHRHSRRLAFSAGCLERDR